MNVELQLFAAELRAGRTAAVQSVTAALESAGSVRGAARTLGIPIRTLQGWAQRGRLRSIPAVCDAVDALGLRR